MTRATERAFPCPLAAPISASRQGPVLAAVASATGPVATLTSTLSGSRLARSNGSGGGGMSSAQRPQSASRAPMRKSAPSGPAISSSTNRVRLFPVTRRTISPRRWPKVSAWYPEAVPGSHHGAWAASAAVDRSRSYMPGTANGLFQPARPEVWLIRCRTRTPSFPLAANSGQ